jgi:hypothetical protein
VKIVIIIIRTVKLVVGKKAIALPSLKKAIAEANDGDMENKPFRSQHHLPEAIELVACYCQRGCSKYAFGMRLVCV